MSEFWNKVQKKRKSRKSGSVSSDSDTPLPKKAYLPSAGHGGADTECTPTHPASSATDSRFNMLLTEECTADLDSDAGDTKTQLKTIIDLMRDMCADLKEIRRTQNKIESRITAIEANMEAMDDKVDMCQTAIETLHESQEQSSVRQDEMNAKVLELEKKTCNLQSQLSSQEDHSRRNNLVFYGLTEEDNETWDMTEKKVRGFMKENMKIEQADDNREWEIERARRLGRKSEGRHRPVIVRFLKWKKKTEALERARNIPKGVRGRIDEDYSKPVREARKLLYIKMKEARSQGKRANMKYDKLCIEGRVHTVDSCGSVVPSSFVP